MRYSRVAAATDEGLGARARLGLIVLKTDETIEHEGRQVLNGFDGVALYHARIHNDVTITRETLLAMQPLLPETARLLPPEWGFRAIGFGCTSASMLMGDAAVTAAIRSVHPGVAVSNPVTAVVAACAALGVSRIGVVTPYARSVNEAIASGLTARGLEIPAFVSFEEPNDSVVAKLSPSAVAAAAAGVAREPGVEAVFISCTSIRVAGNIQALEQAAGKPVTSSNHALYWHMLRLAGVVDSRPELGQLYTRGVQRDGIVHAAE
jgi:maleate isomerase